MTRGELLKKLRIDNGYTQKEVAERIGVHPATVMKYEKGLIRISSETLERLASIYNIETADLFDVNPKTLIDPFKALKSTVNKVRDSTGIGTYANLPEEVKAMLVSACLGCLKEYYNEFPSIRE